MICHLKIQIQHIICNLIMISFTFIQFQSFPTPYHRHCHRCHYLMQVSNQITTECRDLNIFTCVLFVQFKIQKIPLSIDLYILLRFLVIQFFLIPLKQFIHTLTQFAILNNAHFVKFRFCFTSKVLNQQTAFCQFIRIRLRNGIQFLKLFNTDLHNILCKF